MPPKPITRLESTCADLLRVPSKLPDEQRRGRMNARLHALGHSTPCGRCGGSGNYSFNPINGTRCFGCGGAGGLPPKVTKELIARVEQSVATGALDQYLVGLRALQAAQGAEKRVLDAWIASGVSKAYDWQKAAKGVEPDRRIADEINGPMNAANKAVQEMAGKLSSVGFRLQKAGTQEEREALEAERLVLARAVVEETERALATIQERAKQLQAMLSPRQERESAPAP